MPLLILAALEGNIRVFVVMKVTKELNLAVCLEISGASGGNALRAVQTFVQLAFSKRIHIDIVIISYSIVMMTKTSKNRTIKYKSSNIYNVH